MPDDLARHFLLNPGVTFLNHGSYGACPRPVMEAYRDWQERLEAQPVAFMDPAHLTERFSEVRIALGAEIGADPDDLVWVTNATAGLNIVARSLDLGPGDEVLTTDHEYSALTKTWAFVAGRAGAVIRPVRIPLPLTEEAFADALRKAITDRTKVLFLSHITSPTALVFPIAGIVAEARARGIVTIIDGAHAPGHIPLDVTALGADYYVGNCHKWLMAPKGTAFLHSRPAMQALLDPRVISHGWTEAGESPGPFGGSAFLDRFQFQGTRDPSAWLAVPAAIRFRNDHDWGAVSARCGALAQEIAAEFAGITGLPALAAPEVSAPQMIAMPIPDCDTEKLHRDLLSRYGIEIPVLRWAGRCFVRLSIQGYNRPEDGRTLLAAVRDLLDLR
ncbi:aminotransferase class V-fold PLP-dependent enzyme [Defluviimonas sp. SAOS-178_SWC]|uniref:aminotransferase class V-fold PLP-dependent enzyme n=1 Tax=Defluviimonas sp. SAOS-178_SWC TaxID=3121287 RepID=UPI00322144B0